MIRKPTFARSARCIAGLLLAASLQAQASAQDTDNGDGPADPNVARLEVKITEMQEQMRRLQGTLEQVSFQNNQLKTQLEKSNSDVAFRLDALEKKSAGAPAAATDAAPNASAVPISQNDSDQLKPADSTGASDAAEDTDNAGSAAPAATPTKFTSSRDHYNYAFQLLNHAKYAEAGDAFSSFTREHPKDPLVGNAYYWLGETYYVRKDYVKAADDFRKGYQAMPAGPKAPDNLLKLAMSLNALNKDKDACVVLKQVEAKFSGNASSIKSRADQEMNRIGCS